MKVCAVELKSNYTVLTLVDYSSDDIIDYIDLKIKKITLEDDEDKNSVLKYLDEINSFFKNNNVEKILIKKRSKKGAFSGGAVSFKMEGLIQIYSDVEVKLVTSQSISSYEKKNNIIFPSELKKYQEQSFLTILAYLCK
ncbi:MAG: hypothetical protein CL623_06415 [Arcobacter sp.]|nr:hypothetical protein [Arcobacter sp.]|tara:strand:+ start:6143 stop:6559 length:417 start_codon:yes stop_codon:yes gene_type:complete